HESWKGPSDGWAGSVGFADWVTVGIGDGMYNQVDPTDSRWVYNTQEFGGHGRYDQKTRQRVRIVPARDGPAARAIQLDRSLRALAAQSPDVVRRGPGAVPLGGSRRSLAGDQPRSHHQRRGQDQPQRRGKRNSILHYRYHFRIAGDARNHLGGHRRWQGASDAEQRRQL